METRRWSLTYPSKLIKEPVLYRVAKDYKLVPNIRKARGTETTGEVLVDFSGKGEGLKKGLNYLTGLGITVKEVREWPRSGGFDGQDQRAEVPRVQSPLSGRAAACLRILLWAARSRVRLRDPAEDRHSEADRGRPAAHVAGSRPPPC